MTQFDFKGFLKEGGVEKYLLEARFGNDIDSRYEYIRPLMSRLPDSARTEMLIDGMEEARAEDDKQAFDFYFVEAMKELGMEDELMEPDDDITPPGPEDMPGAKVPPFITDKEFQARANAFALEENDDVLDEMLDEDVPLGIAPPFAVGDLVYRKSDDARFPMKVVKMRKMFASPLHAVTVVGTSGGDELEYDETQLVKLEEIEGEVQTEAMSDQLKINKLLQAANTIEDSLNDVNLELTDEQIDKFTEMILDLRDKAKAKLTNEAVSDPDKVLGVAQKQAKINNEDEWDELVPKIVGLKVPGVSKSDKIQMVKAILKQLLGSK